MAYYVIDSSNSIHNTDDTPLGGIALSLGFGDDAIVMADGSVLGTGAAGTGIYVSASAGPATVIVNGFVFGTSSGIHSLGSSAQITINGQVASDSIGISITGGDLYVSPTGQVTGAEGIFMSSSYVIIDGTVNGTGNDAIQISSGSLTNNGRISAGGDAIFYTGDGAAFITNTGTIQGSLLTYFSASAETAQLTIDNRGDWFGTIDLTEGDDSLINTGTITGDIYLEDGNNSLDSRYGFVGGQVTAGSGTDTILLGAGDTVIVGGGGGDIIDGGVGFDIVNYAASPIGVRINFLNGTASRGEAQGDRLTNIEGVYGTLFRDVLVGDDGDNVINGVLGGDTLTGNGGNDTITMLGAGGATTINAGSGNDLIQLTSIDSATYGFAFRAVDKVNGGGGYDTLEITDAPSVVFTDFTVTNIELIVLGDGFSYKFTSANATVTSGARLWVDAGSLTGFNNLRFDGSAETNGAFDFFGGAWRDEFTGGAGDDTFLGGDQRDLMTGGAGSDLFVYENSIESRFSHRDQITDFDTAADTFQFDVEVLAVAPAASGSVSTSADLAALVSGQFGASTAMLVNVTGGTLSGLTLLLVDANGTAGFQPSADYVIDVTGITGMLTLGDFIVG